MKMAWLVTLLIVKILCEVHGTLEQVDIERRLDKKEPYDGLNSFTARYRYPVYIRKRGNGEQVSDEDSNEQMALPSYQDAAKRVFGDYDMSMLSRILDSGKKRMAMPLSELAPNMASYSQMLNAGKRSPLNSLYDLPNAHRLFQVGKRNYHSLDLDTLESILQAGKRSYHGLDLGNVNKMMQVGKKSYGGMDVNAVDRLMQAGKRGYDSLDLHAIERLIQAGKRNYQGMDLQSLNKLMQAGKRSYQGLDLEALNRLVQAGKRNYESEDVPSAERPVKVEKRSYGTVNVPDTINEDDQLKNGILLDIPLLQGIYEPEKRTNLLTRNIRPSVYDIKDMSRILEAGKKRRDNREKRRIPSKEVTKNENEENQTKGDNENNSDDSHERSKRSVKWEDIFGIDRKKRSVDWSTVFGIDRKKRSSDWSNVFGIDRKKRSWDDYFGYDKKNELQEELFDEWLANKYLENFNNNLILTKIDDDDEEEGRFGRTELTPPRGYAQL